MSSAQVAEALFKAHKDKATGWLTVVAQGRSSKLLLKHGEVVEAQMGLGHQGPLNALLQGGKMTLQQLDAIWARGEAGQADGQTLEELGTDLGAAATLQVIANVRRLVEVAESAQFEPAKLDIRKRGAPGHQVVRAAFESISRSGEAPYFRCDDLSRAGDWVADADRTWLADFSEARCAEGLTPPQRALLEVLAKDGLAEEISAEQWRKRQADETARREDEERRVREAEARKKEEERAALEAKAEAERRAQEEALRQEEERKLEEQRRLEEEKRLAEEARLRAEKEARETEERRQAEEQARLQAEWDKADEQLRLAEERQEQEAKERAEAETRREQERLENLKRIEEAQRRAEELARAEEQARKDAERQEALRAAEEQSRLEAERARRAADERLESERLRAAQEAERAQREAEEAEARRAALRAEEERLEAERLRTEEEARLEEERAQREAEAEAHRAALRAEEERLEAEAQHAQQAQAAEAALRAEEQARADQAAAASSMGEETVLIEAEVDSAVDGGEAQRFSEDGETQHRENEIREQLRFEEERLEAEGHRAEEARLAEQRRQAALEDDVEDDRRRREEARRAQAARIDEDLRRAEELAQQPEAWVDDEVQERQRVQSDLLERMNRALRQSTATPEPTQAEEAPVIEGSFEGTDPNLTDPSFELPTAVTEVPDQGWAQSGSAMPLKPLILGPEQGQNVDLWGNAEASAIPRPISGVRSFEEALSRVDASLETLDMPDADAMGEPIEATVETVIEAELDNNENPFFEADLADPSDPAEAARLRRQRLLKRAMQNLGSLPQRPVVEGAVTVESMPAASSEAPAPSAPSAPATASDQQLAEQIEHRFAELTKRKELYAILGISTGASKEQVKAAFLGLAKVYHPDRLPPSLGHLAPKLSTVFESIREAYETLYDDAKRAAYFSKLQAGTAQTAAPSGSDKASELMKMGEVFFKKRDYRHSEDHFARAHVIDGKASSLAARAWAIYMDPSRKAEAAAAKQMMMQSLQLDANCDRAHYQLGVIARVDGDVDRAERHFREAVKLNSKHLEANQELRLIEMRRKKGPR